MAQNDGNSVYDYLGRLAIPKNPEQKTEPTPDIAAMWMGSDNGAPEEQKNMTPDIQDKEAFSFTDFLRGTNAVDRDRAMATQKVAGIAKSLMMQNPDMQTNDVVKYVQKLYPDTWKKVNFSDAFDAIGRALEPVIIADGSRIKEKEYREELRFRSFVEDKPVQVKNDYGFISAVNPYQGKMQEYRQWLIDHGAKLQDSDKPDSRFKIANKHELSQKTINELFDKASADGVTDLVRRAFDFEGLEYGEMTLEEKYKNEKELAWARNAGKPKDFAESMKYITDTFSVDLPEGSFNGISNTYLVAAAKAHWDAARNATPENINKFDNAISTLLVKKDVPDSVKMAMKEELEKIKADNKDAAKADSDYRKSKLDTLKDLLKRKKITQADYDAEIKIMRAQEGKKSDDKPGKWEEQ